MLQNTYQAPTKLDKNSWITPPTVEDPENLPIPLGWTLLVRPYPIINNKKVSSLIMPDETIDYMNYITNIGRVVAVGPSCWSRPEHRAIDGSQEPWAKVGDFVSYPKNVGARRKFKGVSYVLLVDDEILERLPDPQVFDEGFHCLDIPEDHMTKYNTFKKETK